MENTSGELGWDDVIEEGNDDRKILPDGKYKFRVTKVESARFAGGPTLPPCKQANVTIHVTNEQGFGKTIEEKIKLHTSLEWILCSFFLSVGLRKKGEKFQMKWGEVEGRTGLLEMGHRSFRGKDGEDVTVNQVSKWLPPEEESEPATATFTAGEF